MAVDGAAGRERLDRRRRVSRQLVAAGLLERRAGSSASAALAEVLRERAARRRRVADRVRRGLWPLEGSVRPT